MKAVAAFACLAGWLLATGAIAAPAFHALSYDVHLTPDFATGIVSGTERLHFRSLMDDLDAVSFTANPLAVNATLDGAAEVTITDADGRRVFHLPRRLAKGEEATLKRLRKRGASIALEAANPAYETRIFGPDRVNIQGKLVTLVRRY